MQLKCRISSSAVFDHKEAIEGLKHQRGNREEIEGYEEFAMVIQEGPPPLCFALVSRGASGGWR